MRFEKSEINFMEKIDMEYRTKQNYTFVWKEATDNFDISFRACPN